MLTIDIDIARRFILGKQGLWPGRRWQGLEGTEQAMREMEYLQLDPLQIITRSQDILLHSRVVDYEIASWEEVTYQQRKFFDWGGWLACRPMDELPYWRTMMHRERDGTSYYGSRIKQMGVEHADAIAEMRDILKERGIVSNRDFSVKNRKRTESYRGRKDSSLALYYLWRIGDVMTHHREKFERYYALAETVAGESLLYEVSDAEYDLFSLKKEISFAGLSRMSGAPFSKKKAICEALIKNEEVVPLTVEGWRATHFVLAEDIEHIETLVAGRIPEAWTPLDTTTSEEVVFLAPLDNVSGRGRAKVLFEFDYVWEVYKPKDKRKYGYYTLPVLWGDQLVARFDSKFDKTDKIFTILGFWLEDEELSQNEDFVEALARGFERFGKFLGAAKYDVKAVKNKILRQRLKKLR